MMPGAYLAKVRTRRRMSRYRLADLAGVTPQYVFRLETRADETPSPRLASRLCSALDIDYHSFVELIINHRVNRLIGCLYRKYGTMEEQ